jgi:hypothetical protein
MPIIMMIPLLWFVWLNESMALMLRTPRRRPALRVIEGGRERGAARLLKRPAVRRVR